MLRTDAAIPDLDARTADTAVRRQGGRCELVLSVPGMHCGACMRTIETGLAAAPGVLEVRVNLTLRRVRVVWREGVTTAAAMLSALRTLGFDAHIPDPDREAAETTRGIAGCCCRLRLPGLPPATSC